MADLSDLRRALTNSVPYTLDDERLAFLAMSEMEGVDVDALYPDEMRQIEENVVYAEMYAELVEMLADTAVAPASMPITQTMREVIEVIWQKAITITDQLGRNIPQLGISLTPEPALALSDPDLLFAKEVEEMQLRMRVYVNKTGEIGETCDIIVEAIPFRRRVQKDGRAIQLNATIDNIEKAWLIETDTDGRATFTDIPASVLENAQLTFPQRSL